MMLLSKEEKNDHPKSNNESFMGEKGSLVAFGSCYDRIAMDPPELAMPNRLSPL